MDTIHSTIMSGTHTHNARSPQQKAAAHLHPTPKQHAHLCPRLDRPRHRSNLAIHKPPPPQLLQLLRYRIRHRNTRAYCRRPSLISYIKASPFFSRGRMALDRAPRRRPSTSCLVYIHFGRLGEHGPRAQDAAHELAVDPGIGARVHLEVVVDWRRGKSQGLGFRVLGLGFLV